MERNWSELELIELLASQAQPFADDGLIKGIGDDCAVFANRDKDKEWLATTDILVEKIHFDLDWHSPYLLGRKAVAVNVSDIAAMGGTPVYALISIAIPDHVDRNFIAELTKGITTILAEHRCSMIGGDTTRGPVLTMNIVILGACSAGKAVLRDGAKPGDLVYVSGNLGSAAAGLEISRHRSLFTDLSDVELEPLIEKHLNPDPRVQLGQMLGEKCLVTAMQDLSDGLATDLAHICRKSNVGAEVGAERLPGHPLLESICTTLRLDPIVLKISGGDDYELLFTVRPDNVDALLMQVEKTGVKNIHQIGTVVPGSGVTLVGNGRPEDISFKGYQHGAHHD